MVTMFRGPRWKIAVYGRDHGVPHFHIEGPDFRCSVAIASFDVIVGTVSAAVLKDALEWARPNQALLMQTWQELKRSEEHTSELQSLMRISYAVFFLHKQRHTFTTNIDSKPTI